MTTGTATRMISCREAVAEALKQEMRADDRVFVAGIDLAERGDVFGLTQGILAEFGSRRILDTPISENAIAGLGDGRGFAGAAAGDLDDVHRLYRRRLRPDHEPAGEDEVHVRRSASRRSLRGRAPTRGSTRGSARGRSPGRFLVRARDRPGSRQSPCGWTTPVRRLTCWAIGHEGRHQV